jgi:hypothetical protein
MLNLPLKDIYLLFIDFTNAFGSLDHARLLAIMYDLGFPEDATQLVGSIYLQSYTTFIGPYFGKTKSIPILRGTIQGDTFSPLSVHYFSQTTLMMA